MKRTLIVLLIATLLLTACASAKDSSEPIIMEVPTAAPQEMANEEYAYVEEDEKTGYDSGSGVEAQSVERLVIKNAYLNIAVADPVKSLEEISQLAENMGGFVVSSNVYKTTLSSGVQVPQGNIQIRVPAERLDEAMKLIKAMVVDAETGVISENVSGQDVTSDYVDSKSRLRNLEAAEAQLVELLDSAPDLQYTLEIFKELTSIRSEIEVLKGHINYLEESAAMSAISVDLIAEKTLQPIEIGGWKPKGIVKDAVEALVKTLQTIGSGLIWFGIYCLPFLIPLGVVVYFVVKGRRKAKAKKGNQIVEVQSEKKE
jgi:hypothetical protein